MPDDTIEEVESALQDMAGRHYMNVFGKLRGGDIEEAAFELGAANALQQFRMMVEYFDNRGEWPADTPNADYITIVEKMDQTTESDKGADGSKLGVH